MGNKIIGCSESYTAEQFQELYTYAQTLDITLKDIPLGSTDASLTADCDALFGDFEEELLLGAKKATWMQSSWDGADGLVVKEPIASGRMVLSNAAGAYDTMIAEYLLGGTLTLLHQFLPYRDAQMKHTWRSWVPAYSISEKRITVLGCGRIGQAYARMAHAIGAKVTGVSRTAKPAPDYLEKLVSIDELDAILPETDILVMLLPMARDNDKLMDARRIGLMPEGSYILNAGRGKPLDAYACGDALKSGHLAGAVLDVFPSEPLKEDDPLWDIPNLLITPHKAGHGEDAYNMNEILMLFKDNMTRWAHGEPLLHVIDVTKGY